MGRAKNCQASFPLRKLSVLCASAVKGLSSIFYRRAAENAEVTQRKRERI